ncbi:FecR family protein [Telluribacter sp. SYSU D00476]|uniref:FecR family protein n=1 Tax=Telluribacter sp. SYSU D00476 TaxID=2811430 RepID=UPI001FF4AA27|nr:FecR domain-containing protein [Telluribacter sp. SYSU D00476]
MNENELEKLLQRFRDGTCTQEEKELLELWFEKTAGESEWNWESKLQRELVKQQILANIHQETQNGLSQPRRLWSIMRVAASVAIVLFAGWYFLIRSTSDLLQKQDYREVAVTPGSNQAMLILSDGSSVLVGSAASGVLSKDGSAEVVKTEEGGLEYKKSGIPASANIRNTLFIPKGGTFNVTLPDGSRVWINSATRITYPADNSGTERLVELSGEAYFEVRPDKERPFKVLSGNTEIIVTGTHFNVSAYEDEKMVATTLAEGQVIVKKDEASLILRPGQQALSSAEAPLVAREVDVESMLAWKEGYFVFDDMDLHSVMKVVARWYDVEVEYEAGLPSRRFGGTFSKSKDLDGLLSYLEQLGTIHFKRQGKKVMVTK